MSNRTIRIRGARTHNLKNVNLDVPQRELTVLTGPSGSGKSSLAFDTLYAEGQRRFVESMSTYVRQFLERMERPDVDEIEGVLPSLAIEQKNSVKNARSTVATATELADYLRLFFTYCGETICPDCRRVVRKESPESIVETLSRKLDGQRAVVIAPVFFEGANAETVFAELKRAGYFRVWEAGEVKELESLDQMSRGHIDVVISRMKIGDEKRNELTDAIEQAFTIAKGFVNVLHPVPDGWASERFSSRFACDGCAREFVEPTPHLFSFNSPLGACTECQGYGRVIGIDMEKVIPVRSQRLDELPIAPWNSPGYESSYSDLEAAAKKYRLRLDVPIEKLTEDEWDILYNGRGKWYGIKGFFDWLETKKYKIHVRVKLAKYRSYTTCMSCGGSRLKSDALHVRFRDLTIANVLQMNVRTARKFWEFLPMSKQEEAIAGHLRRDILNRLVYLDEVGLSYLTLDRQTRTLSGGESQRINLAAALGSGLTETLYVIDEPTVGLHARDSDRLLAILRKLKNNGNTVVVVEHDPTIIDGADHVVEMGPGAGERGGEILSVLPQAKRAAKSGEGLLEDFEPKRPDPSRAIRILGAQEHNLKNVDVTIPLDRLVAITGVSGSGKSTLVRDCLFNGFQRAYRAVSSVDVGRFERIEGVEELSDIQFVDQSPIGRSARSNPATYVKAWDEIRKLLADSTSAKLNGVTAGMLSFNTTGGRCETCQGAGLVTVDMQFLADIEVVCETCNGKRFTDRVLKITYKGKNVDDILAMTVDDAVRFFLDKRQIVKKLDSLRSVGLGYLRLGQSTASLSGGEAQRLKLASFLSTNDKDASRRLFLFDEPTTGLHSSDIRQLLQTMRALVERGNSVVVIEHNLQFIAACDWVIDLGPEGGDGGGEIVATGTPFDITENERSLTGRYLKPMFEKVPATA
jgi:excinuclease ABC subunit A